MNGRLLGALGAVLMIPTSAAAVPDYLWFSDYAERAAMMAHSSKSCQRLGYVVDEAALVDHVDGVVEAGVKSGIPLDHAQRTFGQALHDEEQRQRYLADRAKASDDAAQDFVRYWDDRCASLASEVYSGAYFKLQ